MGGSQKTVFFFAFHLFKLTVAVILDGIAMMNDESRAQLLLHVVVVVVVVAVAVAVAVVAVPGTWWVGGWVVILGSRKW